MKCKIAVVTGSRAEYGLLYWLMKEIQQDADLELQVIVTGMHLSPEFGLTYRYIEADAFKIDAKVEMLMSSDTAVGVAKSIGLCIIGFSDTLQKLAPDLLILLGDRFESLAVAQAALVHKIPLAHIHGGELSAGAIDDAIRHAITKMSHLHFVAAERYAKRVIQLGEHPDTVFNVGTPGLERIKRTSLLSRAAWQKQNNFILDETKKIFLITYHPLTIHVADNLPALNALFAALDYFKDALLIFTRSNADEAGRFVNAKIDEYLIEEHNCKRGVAYVSLGDLNYLSLLQYVDVVIGNSSSGLIEVPYFAKPTVNIGSRQDKRLRGGSVIDCPAEFAAIVHSIQQALAPDFIYNLKSMLSPYEQNDTSKRIIEIIKKTDLKQCVAKQFYDLEA